MAESIGSQSASKGGEMPVIKVIEIIGTSESSWEDAAAVAVSKATKTIHNITGAEVIAQTAKVENGAIREYRTTLHVAFALDA
jgi:flavin-binding protein dodecin